MGLKRFGHEYGEEPVDHKALAILKLGAGLPDNDPVYGSEGPLPKLWRKRENMEEILSSL